MTKIFELESINPIGFIKQVYPQKFCDFCRGELSDVCGNCQENNCDTCLVTSENNAYYHTHCKSRKQTNSN